ncbi:MAG: TonB-dependent receptor [Dokdonella sp.]|uniref:TonB-dependent receptor n=1 Tax=Dokdonella sp. TaxID=2291710 RepID=UPI003F7E9E44
MPFAQCTRHGAALILAVLALLRAGALNAQQRGDEDVDALDLVRVVGVTPLTGTELPAAKLPYDVQSTDDAAFSRAQVAGLADYLDRHLAGVSSNAAQNSPLQPDLQFRGYTATPLLGGAEGLSVYLDGVRVNEVFGDTVNWDLVPDAAIERMSLFAGANPIFGLNTLGGAIAIRTKSGFSDPGTRVSLYGGSFGRSDATFETAGNAGTWGWYLMGRRFDEDGWRDASPSNAKNLYGTLSWRGDAATFDLHLGHGDTDLTGNGPAPVQQLAGRWQAVFTAPDETANRMDLASGEGSLDVSEHAKLSFTLFHRAVTTRSYNGDGSDFEECDDDATILCDGGEAVLDQHGAPLPATFDAINNISRRRQRSNGATVQLAIDAPLAGRENQLVVGLDANDGRLRFDSAVEAAMLDADRHTSADSGLFIPDAALAVRSRTRSLGLYATDTLSLTERLALTLSARGNHTRTTITDPGGENPDLDGRHRFSRINPAAGFTWRWSDALNAYAGYSESTRAPTPVELTCADEDAPCKLPNQFLSDPPLEQVVAKGWEAGLRGALVDARGGDRLDWRVGAFRTTNTDDILFQATGGTQSNEGFFANVGDTRRQGLQAGISGTSFGRRLAWHANASWLDATYRSAFVENSAHHPDADDDGLIAVRRGDRIPGLPRASVKLGADFAFTPAWSLGGDVVANTGQYLRGDEANRLARTGGWAVVNLRAEWSLNAHASVFARVDNVFDRRYVTFGTLGDASEVFDAFDDPRFLGPAAPRGAWVGVRLSL